jgi:hypothetical protein
VAKRNKARIWDSSLAGNAGSNSAGSKDMFLWVLCLSGRGLCDGPIIRPEESYRLWCVIVYNIETWTVLGCCSGRGGGGKSEHRPPHPSQFQHNRVYTLYRLDGPKIESLWGLDFPHPSRSALGPTQPGGTGFLFRRAAVAWCSPPPAPSAEVKEVVQLHLYSPSVPSF